MFAARWRQRAKPRSESARRSRVYRPQVEVLEDRRLLSGYTVNDPGLTGDGDVSDGICDTGNADAGFTGKCTLLAAAATVNHDGGGTITLGVDVPYEADFGVSVTIDGGGFSTG